MRASVVVTALIGFLQLLVFGYQALNLKHTIYKMDEIAKSQAEDIRDSIAEATRAATAMEQLAGSTAVAAKAAKESADTANANLRLAMRPHISVVPKDFNLWSEFPRDYMLTMQIINTGTVPARLLKVDAEYRTIASGHEGTASTTEITRTPGQSFDLPIHLELSADEITQFETKGIVIPIRVMTQLEHPIDGPFWHTFDQLVHCSPGKQPDSVEPRDYPGRQKSPVGQTIGAKPT